jgi:hypothetical protein
VKVRDTLFILALVFIAIPIVGLLTVATEMLRSVM